MEIGFFGIMSLLGFMLFFEGFSRKNPFMAWAGAIILMVSGTEVLSTGINYPSGAVINETVTGVTTVTYTYTNRTDWFVTALGRLFFWVGWFGLVFPVSDYLTKKRGSVG